MTHESPESLMLVLCRGAGSSRVVVDLESFLIFNSQMDHDLQHLVDARRRNADLPRETVLTEIQGLQELLEQNPATRFVA